MLRLQKTYLISSTESFFKEIESVQHNYCLYGNISQWAVIEFVSLCQTVATDYFEMLCYKTMTFSFVIVFQTKSHTQPILFKRLMQNDLEVVFKPILINQHLYVTCKHRCKMYLGTVVN